MIKEINQVLKTNKKDIVYDLFLPEKARQTPIVVFCHGYKGFKDWGAWNLMAEKIANAGIGILKFNFSHNGGTAENPIDFPDEKAFGENTYSQEIEDLENVLLFLPQLKNKYPNLDLENLYLLGHSRGGAIVSYVGTKDIKVKKIITLASVSHFDRPFRISEEELIKWKKDGVRYVENKRTKQQLPHYYSFYEDYEKNKDEFDLEKAFQNRNVPHLILHGDKDEAVSLEEAKNLQRWNKNATLNILKNAGHTFGAMHPYELNKLPSDLEKATEYIIHFIKS
ncbi:MAG TPA: prolyl oligopeptidase family serine peptidase [Chitinophagaceae bacterium]|nr:prolyl oligopeptidase family serine peptidase [Chitinophagaceae bacterium]